MRVLRVLQIVPSVSLIYGGPSQMVLSLSAALAKAGIDVTLLTTNSNGDTGQPPLDVPIGEPISQDGYQILYFPCSPFRRYKFSLGLLSWLTKHAIDFDVAHIHALFSPVSTAAATIARWQGLPYILRPLGTLDPADLRKKALLKQIYGRLWEKPNLTGAAGVHFTSAEECRISERFGSNTKDLVIPLGVELPSPSTPEYPPHPPLIKGGSMEGNDLKTPPTPEYPPLQSFKPPLQRGVWEDFGGSEGKEGKMVRENLGISADDLPLILFMSRIDPKKGLDLLIPAMETLLNEGLGFHFVLAGSNPQNPVYEKKIQDRIKSSKLVERTTITGFVQGDLKWRLLQEADLFVLPSDYENFGIAVAEAIACSTPVVISRGVYIWEDIEKAIAGWVTTSELDALTTTLRLALKDGEERKRRGINGQKLALNRYSWEAIARQLIDVYQLTVSSKK